MAETSDNGEKSSSILRLEEDQLSSLPDCILIEILSHLPITSAAATSVLSRRWRTLWTQIVRLNFCVSEFPKKRTSNIPVLFDRFIATIDHIFIQLTSPQIHSFRLNFRASLADSQRKWSSSYVDSWIRQICCRNVEGIEVSIGNLENGPLITIPNCVFECQSLIQLKLPMGFSFEFPVDGAISLRNLKLLRLNLHDSDRELMRRLFRSCPKLEQLKLWMDLFENEHFVDISAQYLKRLTICVVGKIQGTQFMIDAPKLENLEIFDRCVSSHRFIRKPSGLLEAKIDALFYVDDGCEEDELLKKILGILQSISSVGSLFLNSYVLRYLKYVDDGVMPIFHGLTLLTVKLYHRRGWNDLLFFLRYSPNLETLELPNSNHDIVQEGMHWTAPHMVATCLLTKLKRVNVSVHNEVRGEVLMFLQYILSNANALEELCVCVSSSHISDLLKELKLCDNLFSHPRSSVTCEVKFSSDNLCASSKGFQNGSLDCQILCFT